MKTTSLISYLDELEPEEVVEIYERTPAKILRAFNASPTQVQRLIETEFPEEIRDLANEETDESEKEAPDAEAELESEDDED